MDFVAFHHERVWLQECDYFVREHAMLLQRVFQSVQAACEGEEESAPSSPRGSGGASRRGIGLTEFLCAMEVAGFCAGPSEEGAPAASRVRAAQSFVVASGIRKSHHSAAEGELGGILELFAALLH